MQLGQRQSDGQPLRAHLQGAAASSGFVHPLLDDDLPPGGQLLVDLLNELSDCRPQGMGPAGGLPPSELEAWQRLHGVRLTPWELDTLQAMDRAARGWMHAHPTKTASRKGAKPATRDLDDE